MVLVYGTLGTKEENEWSLNIARSGAEAWYYRGNGAVDIITDKQFSLKKYSGRDVILYGNRSTNAAWKTLLSDCRIQLDRNMVKAGDKTWSGDDLAGYFTWPVKNSLVSAVAVITSSGLMGMEATDAHQYFAVGSGFGFMIFRLGMLVSGAKDIQMAGFFDNEWKLISREMERK